MLHLELSDNDRETIAEALDDPSIDERTKRKLLAIRMHDLNVPHASIASTLNITDDTVTNYLKLYQAEGLTGLLENRFFQPTSKVAPFFEAIKKSLANEPVASAKEGAARIKKLTTIELSETQARRIMKQLGLEYRKTASIPGGADPQLQLDFLAKELLPRLEEAQKGQRRVFFVDAAHFVLGAFLGMIWCFTRIFIRSASGRQRYSVLGAVETRNHDLVTIQTTGSINAESVCELILKIDKKYPGEEITLVMDNARYQYNARVQDLAKSLNIELLYLPAYSPNLNLIERVWKLVKSKCLRNHYYEDFGAFRSAIDKFLHSLQGTNRPLLQSLITENFQTYTIPKP
jgi:transposase